MKYTDGETIKVGDVVWYCHGTAVCRVVLIVDNEKLLKEWGQEEHGIFLGSDPLSLRMECNFYILEKNFKYDDIFILEQADWDDYLLKRFMPSRPEDQP